MTSAETLAGAPSRTGLANRYRGGVEWLRLVACLAIVAFHAQTPGHLFMLGGLSAFTALTVAFAVRSSRSKSWSVFVWARIRTLGVPWLFWFVFYGVFVSADAVYRGEPPLGWVTAWSLLRGPAIHLWFLPFAFAASLLVSAVARRQRPGGWYGWAALALATSVSACMLHGVRLPAPLSQWVSVLPAVFVGACLAELDSGTGSDIRRALLLIGIMETILLGTLALLGFPDGAIPHLVGLPLILSVWTLRAPATPRLLALSRLSYGVYLTHPFFMRLFHKWFAGAPWQYWLAVSTAALAAAWALKRTALRRFV